MEYRDLLVKLEQGEMLAKAETLAAQLHEKGNLDREKTEFMDDYKRRVKELEARIGQLLDEVRHCQEVRSVACQEHYDYGKRLVTIVRTDTGEVVDTRPMTDAERQVRLFEVPDPTSGEQAQQAGNAR